jgi:anti-anti-sigma factor
MKIETQLAPDYAVLRLVGDFETYAVGVFLAAVRDVREAGHDRLVLNLRRVKFLNSTAIGAILRVRKELAAAGGGIALARTSAFVREVLQKLGLDDVLPMYDDEEGAAEALLASAGTRRVEARPAEEDVALFFRFYSQDRADLLGGKGVGAGEIALLDLEGITFTWDARGQGLDQATAEKLFAPGTELELKFRLPLYARATYYVTRARVASCEVADGCARVRAAFAGLEDEAARAVRQYVADMQLVREEIEQARQEEGGSASA